jgi:hypothetical protein
MLPDLLDPPAHHFIPALQLAAPAPPLRSPWKLGMYLLALLPLLLTLVFLGLQLSPWGDACPLEAPCEGSW